MDYTREIKMAYTRRVIKDKIRNEIRNPPDDFYKIDKRYIMNRGYPDDYIYSIVTNGIVIRMMDINESVSNQIATPLR